MELIEADLQRPTRIRACVTTRRAGVSRGPWAAGNLGDHVGDDPAHVAENRRRLLDVLEGAGTLHWLRQVHGTTVHTPGDTAADYTPEADAAYTRKAGQVLAVLTADCLPVCLVDDAGSEIAVAHAGWRGLAAGVLERTLDCFDAPPSRIHAWLGPAIGPCHFEVGEDVKAAFMSQAGGGPADETAAAFSPGRSAGKWQADLYALARVRLRQAGVQDVTGGGACTYCDETHFYSHRRDGPETGRFATLIYLLP